MTIAIVAMVALALVLLYENSTSKDMWTAVQTLLVVIAGTYLARGVRPTLSGLMVPTLTALAAVTTILIFTPTVDKAHSVGTMFLMDTSTRKPVFIRLMPFQAEVEGIADAVPGHAWKVDNDGGILVYHHLLQRAILQYLVRQQSRRAGHTTTSTCGWPPEIWQEKGASTATIDGDEIKRIFAANRFITAGFFPHPELVVRKGTRLLGVVPTSEPGHEAGVIELKNPWFDLKIETGFRANIRGIQGNYALLLTGGSARTDPCYSAVAYDISVSGRSQQR